MSHIQWPLFDMDAIEQGEPHAKPTRWYYITRWRNQDMLHYIAGDGTPVWTENDTRQVQPQLYTSHQAAKKDMKKFGGDDVVRYTGWK